MRGVGITVFRDPVEAGLLCFGECEVKGAFHRVEYFMSADESLSVTLEASKRAREVFVGYEPRGAR